MRRAMTILTAGALVCVPAIPSVAQDRVSPPTTASLTAQIAQGGTWDFRTRDRTPDGTPLCTESWTFRADSTGTVISGKQTVETQWRAEVDGDGLQWLYTTSMASTAGPDCMGRIANPADYPRPESGFVLLMFSNGVILTCQPPQRVEGPEKGGQAQLWTDEGCWGSIAPRGPSAG